MKLLKNKRFINYSKQFIDKNDINGVVNVLRGNFLTQGPKIIEFENDFKKYVNVKYAASCATGTAALHLACMALDINKRSKVVVPDISFVATANCSEFMQAKTIFCDVDMGNFCLDLDKLEKILKSNKIDLVIVVHMAGNITHMERLFSLKKKYKFYLIEDACHALGGKYKKHMIGSCKFSDISTFSFHPVKPITTGEGGMVTTNNKKIYDKIILNRTHGITKNVEKFTNRNLAFQKKNEANIWYYEMCNLSWNYRITDIQASLGVTQLKKINKFIKKRNKIANIYNQAFKNNNIISLPTTNKDILNAYHLYTILIDFNKLNISKNEFMKVLRKNNIGTQVLYIPIHLQPYYKRKYNYKSKDFTNSMNYYSKCLSIPLFHDLKTVEVKLILKNIFKLITTNLR